MTKIDRRKALILLSVVAVAAILGSIVLVYGANGFAGSTSEKNAEMMLKTWGMPMQELLDDSYNITQWPCGPHRWQHGWPRGWEHHGFIEVSEEFEENVINITKNDSGVQNLLADGYNITGVRPIIKARVEANGDVVMKATSAIVILRKDTTGSASVWVNVEEGKVTRIVILTRTVIEKP